VVNGQCPTASCAEGWDGETCSEKLILDTGGSNVAVPVASAVSAIVVIGIVVAVIVLVVLRR